MSKIVIWEPPQKRRGCLVLLPGRGIPLQIMFNFARCMTLSDTMLVGIAAPLPGKAWYPMPKGVGDQNLAISGLQNAVAYVNQILAKVMRGFELKPSEIVLMGFSAGAVVANQVALQAKQGFLASVSLSGAILETERIPKPRHDTVFILQHNLLDACFKWEERYMPMRDGLLRQGHQVIRFERHRGEHNLYVEDALRVAMELAPRFGYPVKLKRRIQRKLCRLES